MTLDFTKAAVSDLQSIRNYTLDRWMRNRNSATSMGFGRSSKKSWPSPNVVAGVRIYFLIAKSQRMENTLSYSE